MKKVVLTFPNADSLWLFKDQTKAVNITISPKRNSISGLFTSEEVEMALHLFQAIQLNKCSVSTSTSPIKRTEGKATKSLLFFTFSQVLSFLNRGWFSLSR